MRASIFVATVLASAVLATPASAQRAADLPPTARPAASIAPKVLLHRAAPDTDSRSFLAVAGGTVFLSHANVLESVPRAGGTSTPIAVVSRAPVAATPTSLHWLNVMSVARSMPLPYGPITPAPGLPPQEADMLSGSSLVIASGSLVAAGLGRGVRARPVAGGAITTLFPDRVALALASNGEDVFVMLRGDGPIPASIERLALGNGAPTRIATIEAPAEGLAVDGNYVYWSVRGQSTFIPDKPGPLGKLAAMVADGPDVFALDDKGDLVAFTD